MAYSAAEYPTNLPIPIDLFVSKKHAGLTRDDLGFADASGRIVFKVNRQSSKSSANKLVIVDATGKPVISLHRSDVSLSFPVLFPESVFLKKENIFLKKKGFI